MRPRRDEFGFTLLEAMIAMAIVALVVAAVLAIRTNSLIDAAEARNWRVAREVAQEILSEFAAGHRGEVPEANMDRMPIPSMQNVKNWSYQIVVGEERISSLEGDLESESGADDSGDSADRRTWQRERDDLRKARNKGVSFYEYRESSQLEEESRLEEDDSPPSEDDFEDVAVFVYFPNVRQEQNPIGHFVLKARIPTLAIEGLTPDEAAIENPSEAGPGSGSGAGGAPSGGSEGGTAR